MSRAGDLLSSSTSSSMDTAGSSPVLSTSGPSHTKRGGIARARKARGHHPMRAVSPSLANTTDTMADGSMDTTESSARCNNWPPLDGNVLQTLAALADGSVATTKSSAKCNNWPPLDGNVLQTVSAMGNPYLHLRSARSASSGAGPQYGTTRKEQAAVSLEQMVEELRKKHFKTPPKPRPVDPLLEELTAYHNQLSATVDDFLVEKLTPEVRCLLNPDLIHLVDDKTRPIADSWTPADQARLTKIIADSKRLQAPREWTWGARKTQ